MANQRLHNSTRRHRRSVGIAAAALALLVVACEPVDVFSDYRGVDLLSQRSVGIANWAISYQAGVTPDTDYVSFVALTPGEYGSDAGLPAGSPVYRLEIPNLLPDGDFEASTAGSAPSGWTVDPPSANYLVENAPSVMPDGNFVALEFGSADSAFVNLSTLTDGFVIDALYHFQVDIKRVSDDVSILFDFGDASTSYLGRDDWRIEPIPGQAIVVESVPSRTPENLFKNTLFAARDSADRFYAGAPAADSPFQEGYFDNLRIGRHDVFPHVRFELPLTATGDQLEFLPGRYTFSVFVKSELDTQVTPDTPNRFRSQQLSIGIDEVYETYERADHGWDANSWAELTYSFELSSAKIASGDPLIITLTPSSFGTPAVGAILVAAPRLELDI
ncbi:MAG: hypothetical protein ACLFP4_04860 [Spirochaetales bacterium]